jgi:MFS family permease
VPADHHRPRVKQFRGSVLVSAALGAALTPLNSTMVAVALPALADEFMSPAAAVTVFVVTGYLIATLVLSVPAGSVADRVGYTRALRWGRWMFAAGSIVGTLAPTLGLVVAGRLLMAAGGALINPTAMALLRILDAARAPVARLRHHGRRDGRGGGDRSGTGRLDLHAIRLADAVRHQPPAPRDLLALRAARRAAGGERAP